MSRVLSLLREQTPGTTRGESQEGRQQCLCPVELFRALALAAYYTGCCAWLCLWPAADLPAGKRTV